MVKIFATTDVHGKLYPWDYKSMSQSTSSLCHVKSIIKSLGDNNSIIVDNGDLIQGNFVEKFVNDKNPAILAINDIGYDIWNMGNHEFNFSEKTLNKNLTSFKGTPIIANSSQKLALPFKIIEVEQNKIAFIGITTPMVNSFTNNSRANPIITDPVDVLNKIMPDIKKNSDAIIGLFHVGIFDENSTIHTGVESILKDLLIPFDVIIAGHTHEEIEKLYFQNTLITQPGAYSKSVSLIELDFKNNALLNKDVKLIQSSNFEPDKELLTKIDPFHLEICNYISHILGYLQNVEGNYDYDLEDGPLIHLFTEIMRSYCPTDVVAFQFDFKKPSLKNGAFDRSQLSKIYSYTGGEVTVYEITGLQLKKYINWSYRYLTYSNNQIKVSKRRSTFKYKTLDIFGNIKYTIDLEKENSVIDLRYLSGEPILDSDILTIGMNSYRMNYLTCDRGPLKNTSVKKIISSTDTSNNGKFGTIRQIAEQYFKDLPEKTFVYDNVKHFEIIQHITKN